MNTQPTYPQPEHFAPKAATQSTRHRIRRLTIKLTIKELELLTSLASDQIFRREFIDPKLPGYKPNREDIGLGKAVIDRMRSLLKSESSGQRYSARLAG